LSTSVPATTRAAKGVRRSPGSSEAVLCPDPGTTGLYLLIHVHAIPIKGLFSVYNSRIETKVA